MRTWTKVVEVRSWAVGDIFIVTCSRDVRHGKGGRRDGRITDVSSEGTQQVL